MRNSHRLYPQRSFATRVYALPRDRVTFLAFATAKVRAGLKLVSRFINATRTRELTRGVLGTVLAGARHVRTLSKPFKTSCDLAERPVQS